MTIIGRWIQKKLSIKNTTLIYLLAFIFEFLSAYRVIEFVNSGHINSPSIYKIKKKKSLYFGDRCIYVHCHVEKKRMEEGEEESQPKIFQHKRLRNFPKMRK